MIKLFLVLDDFPVFLHFLTSLLKFILWLKFFHRRKAGRVHEGVGREGHEAGDTGVLIADTHCCVAETNTTL